MFIPKMIVDYSNSHYKNISDYRSKYYEVLKKLSFFKRKKLSKIDKLINEIIKNIEDDSGWSYDVDKFTYKSDFKYNISKNDIVFNLNVVKKKNDIYSPSNFTEREMHFVGKYLNLLDRLSDLEKERDSIYLLVNTVKSHDNLIDFEKNYNEYKFREDNEHISKFTRYQASHFMDRYGIDGLLELVDLLNKFDNNDPISVYRGIKEMNVSKDYKDQLLIWISTYSNSFNKIQKEFDNDKYSEYSYKTPNLEDVKKEYMIKYHWF